jgi:predicted LPLAT superfamily acyltransferase/uncharacterized protein (DUF2062 family)
MTSSVPRVTWRLTRIAPGGGGPACAGVALDVAGDDLPGAVRGLGDAAFTHVVSEPPPGESDPARSAAVLAEAASHPDAVVIGCGSESGGLAASAGRMCLRLETGLAIADPHSPYRAYPLAALRRLAAAKRSATRGVEALVHLSWGGVPVRVVRFAGSAAPASAQGGTAVGFLRHSRLLLRRLVPWPHPRFADRPAEQDLDFRHPIRLMKQLFAEHASPRDLAAAAFLGVFMGALPLLMCHTVAILYVGTRLRLNRAMAVAAQNICAPPLVPALCIEIGYFIRHGAWLTEVSRKTLLLEAHQRLFEWLIGSLIVGPLLGFATALVVLVAARRVERLARRDPARARIDDRRRGNRLGYLSFHVALRLFGRRGAYGLLCIVALHYLLYDPPARRLALAYLRRRFPEHRGWRRAADIYRLFYCQGVSLIDRYRMMAAPASFRQLTARYELVRPLAEDRSKGFILLVSHVGNWQAMMLALRRMERGITLLMRPEHNPVAHQYLRFDASGAGAVRMVSPDLPMGGVIELTRRFNEGDVIAIMGDRSYDAPALPVEFMGDTAQFPCGPFQLAAAWECPVVVLFAPKTGVDEYTVEIADVIRVERGGDRRANLRRAMQTYADRLSEFAARYPCQVYMFDDVWRPRQTDRKDT